MRRFEYKYLVPCERLDELRECVRPFVELDKYAERSGGQYTVRSIYFDTPRLSNYLQKIEGLKMRKKLRIRGYNKAAPDSLVFLEIKRRYGVPIAKNRAPLYYRNLPALLATGDYQTYIRKNFGMPNAYEDAQRFLYNMHRHAMRPVVTVVYDREAFVGKFDHTVRVTFDKNLRSEIFPEIDNLYSDAKLRYTHKAHFILEIKFFGSTMPAWGRSIVAQFGLWQKALSKYTMSIDTHEIAIDFVSTVSHTRMPNADLFHPHVGDGANRTPQMTPVYRVPPLTSPTTKKSSA